jgi:hypothetical protein
MDRLKLWPFFCFYGGKWRAAPHYPRPLYATIIEPFAGSAGYALRYHEASVVLVERDPILAGLWRYIIGATAADFAALPDVAPAETVDNLRICQEAKWLIGFWLNKGAAGPRKTPSAWMRSGTHPNSYWGASVRNRLAAHSLIHTEAEGLARRALDVQPALGPGRGRGRGCVHRAHPFAPGFEG